MESLLKPSVLPDVELDVDPATIQAFAQLYEHNMTHQEKAIVQWAYRRCNIAYNKKSWYETKKRWRNRIADNRNTMTELVTDYIKATNKEIVYLTDNYRDYVSFSSIWLKTSHDAYLSEYHFR